MAIYGTFLWLRGKTCAGKEYEGRRARADADPRANPKGLKRFKAETLEKNAKATKIAKKTIHVKIKPTGFTDSILN